VSGALGDHATALAERPRMPKAQMLPGAAAAIFVFALAAASCRAGPPRTGTGEFPREESVRPEAEERPPAQGPVREPVVAGLFYPAEPSVLRAKVADYVASARKTSLPGRLLAVISPHAGYDYSAPVAGWAFRQLEGGEFDTVFLIGGHASDLPFAAVYSGGAYRTPLGDAPVDADAARALLGSADAVRDDPRPHLAEDHALEVQVPFIQVVLPRARLVPVYYNRPDPALAARVGAALAEAAAPRRAVIVCSTDLSHYPDAETAEEADRAILQAICSLDARRIVAEDRRLREERASAGLSCTACGLGAVLATVEASRLMGATGAVLLKYENSGGRPRGDRRRVVGYGAVAIYAEGGVRPRSRDASSGRSEDLEGKPMTGAGEGSLDAAPRPAQERMLSDEERAELLALARRSVEAAFRGEPIPKPEKLTPALETKTGAFVTLHKRGRLRGCIGTFERSAPLWRVVAEYARHSAFDDNRFAPVEEKELPEIEFEISVLSPMRKLDNPLDLRLGVDGVWVVGSRGERGTFLPQVATETGWTKEEFLSNCCSHKAGLPPEAWRDPSRATVYAYTAEVFSECKR